MNYSPRSGCYLLQGTLQKFLDDLFQAVLSIPPEKPPLAVKYFFDFLEEQADKRGITDPDTLHIWKTNRYRDSEKEVLLGILLDSTETRFVF